MCISSTLFSRRRSSRCIQVKNVACFLSFFVLFMRTIILHWDKIIENSDTVTYFKLIPCIFPRRAIRVFPYSLILQSCLEASLLHSPSQNGRGELVNELNIESTHIDRSKVVWSDLIESFEKFQVLISFWCSRVPKRKMFVAKKSFFYAYFFPRNFPFVFC